MILGIDEVGRGPWAGPLVIGAVVLPDNHSIPGLTDSKKLTAKKREACDALIREQALGWGLGWVHADELDTLGLAESLRVATIRAVEAVHAPYHHIYIDGTINFLKETAKGQYVTVLPKADALIPAVSAASIIAKVARDTYMKEQANRYPGYGFESHVGYGTAQHAAAMQRYGITPLHRVSFAPVAAAQVKRQNTTGIGARAENKVATLLSQRGYSVLERNWKTRYCEVDIIAQKGEVLYFVEVKYRSSSKQGGGITAITSEKIRKMRRGAELYRVKNPAVALLRPRLVVAAVGTSDDIELVEVS